jgi:hypothetical protein
MSVGIRIGTSRSTGPAGELGAALGAGLAI